MSLFAWADARIGRLKWYDIGLIKVGVAAFVLMLVSFWPALLQVDWSVYLVIAVLASVRPAT
jgi:hypothetical protein